MSRGVVFLATNNTRVNYVRLAVLAAAFVKKNMPGTNVALITDQHSKDAYWGNIPLTKFIDQIIIAPPPSDKFENLRSYRDTKYYDVKAEFRNENRSTVYSLSPFDETLLLDVDYLVCNNSLSAVWGNAEDIMLNRDATSLLNQPLLGNEFRLNPFGIRMYWATVIYFKKTERAKMLFDLVEYVKEHWGYFKKLYRLPGTLFRNDYAFSIAIHMLNGFVDDPLGICSLPTETIHSALDTDQFFKIESPTKLTFFANDPMQQWKFYVSRLDGVNVHCMNKLSLINQWDSIMEVLSE